MQCEVCKRTPQMDACSLYRVNEKGVKGIWRCFRCLTPEQKKNLDPEILRIEHILSQGGKP